MSIDDKQERIIKVALKEFALNGYKKTSTDTITKQAQVSKGILFHYFKNKESLYLYLVDYSLNFIFEYVNTHTFDQEDFFDYLFYVVEIKLKIMEIYPYIFEFVLKAYQERDETIQAHVSKQRDKFVAMALNKLDSFIDKDKFKNEADIEKVIALVNYSSHGILNEVLKKDNVDDAFINEISNKFKGILLMLKENLYKKEYV